MRINLLLVDDKIENLIALEALLKRDDINLIKTTSPNEALKICWEEDISIALVDVQMPEMDGFELVQILKSNPKTRDILIIFVTAISKESRYAVRGLSEGAIDYLYKPLDPYITAAKVDGFIQLARYQREIKQKNIDLENSALMIQNSADIICSLDPKNFTINSINPAVVKVLGFQVNDVIGRSIFDFIEKGSSSNALVALENTVKDQLKNVVFEDLFRNIKHESIWLEARVSYHNQLLFLNMSDISIQKNKHEQLTQARDAAVEARKLKEHFLANMSHEIRTPINGIIGISNLLAGTELDADQQNMLKLIQSSSQSLLGVINDILDLSKIEAGKFEIVRSETNLAYLIRSVTELLKFKADEKHISLTYEIDAKLPQLIFADSLRINQILMNLTSNAIKFTEAGFVKISATVLDKVADKITVQISVEDSGIGIAQEKIAHVFERYHQAENDTSQKYGGTGLGLSIVKTLCDLKGAKLKVSSKLGKGSVFSFTNSYTIIDDNQENNTNNTLLTLADLVPFEEPVNLLLAEDNRINQFLSVQLLNKWNVNITIAENGEEAINKLSANDFDIVLMDSHMPVMDGYETTRKIRSELPDTKKDVPIISLSAAVLKSEQQEALKAGMNDVVGKPFDPIDLYKKIQKLTGKR